MEASLKFDKRVRSIARKNRKIARGGHTTYIDEMGVLRRRPAHKGSAIPFKGLLMLLAGFVLFKALILASAGSDAYSARLDLLTSGTSFEQAGAYVLQVDPVTKGIADLLDPIF